MSWPGIIEAYRQFLEVTDNTPIVTLEEGGTPLLPAPRLARHIGAEIDLYLKYEGVNPTGSFKDRGMTLAITKAKEEGAEKVICASTGNTSASAAAYSVRGGMKAYVLIPKGKIAHGKLAQALMHRATILQVEGNFDEALSLVTEVSKTYPITLVNSINPYRLQGQKTAAFEVCDRLTESPTHHFLPVGNAGNITAYWMGYKEYLKEGKISHLPKMMGFQAVGAAPIVSGKVVDHPKTIATAIRIGNPAGWKTAVEAALESQGKIDAVTDDEIVDAYRLIAELEGIFCEPASAAGVAGVIKLSREGYFKKHDQVVCTLTGHGLKDADFCLKTSVVESDTVKGKADLLKSLGF